VHLDLLSFPTRRSSDLKTDLSTLTHVRRSLSQHGENVAVIGESRNIDGLPVVSTAAPIANLGWTVFAEQPLEQAFRPVYASIARSEEHTSELQSLRHLV